MSLTTSMIKVGVVNLARQTSHPSRCVLVFNRTRSSVAATQEDVRPFEEIPGPTPLPIIGNTWRFLPYIGEYGSKHFNDVARSINKKYGNIAKVNRIRGSPDILYLFDPKYVEVMFRNEGEWPIRPGIKTIPYYRQVERKDLFEGVAGGLLGHGKEWYDFRTRVNQTMMQPRNAKQYVGPIDGVTNELIDRMRDLRNEKGELPTNFLDHLMRWALESISVIALDTRLGCLNPDLKPDSEPQKMINAVNYLFVAMFELDTKPNLKHFTKRKEWKEMVAALDLIYEVAMKYIRCGMENIKSKVEQGEREMSVLETLLIKNENPMIATVMAMDMMTAGIDTTSNASAIALHYLARNQDKQEVLFKELQSVLPSQEEPLTARKLEDMKYLKACIKESMRLSPITSGNARETQKEMVIANYLIPKGVMAVVPNMHMSESEELFPEPHRYLPERWLKGNQLQQKAHPFAYLPFGFGPRMCVGRRFAELEIETLLARTLRTFRVEYDQELELKSTVINSVASPLNFRLEERPR